MMMMMVVVVRLLRLVLFTREELRVLGGEMGFRSGRVRHGRIERRVAEVLGQWRSRGDRKRQSDEEAQALV